MLRPPAPSARSQPSAAMSPEIGAGVVAALSEGQRAIAHLVVLLAVPVVVGLVLLVRRVRGANEREQRLHEEQR